MNKGKTPWPAVALLCATATAGYMCRVNVSTAGALLMVEFDLTQVMMGRIFSAFLLGYALFQVPAGMLADQWGARRVFAIITWLWVAITALQALVGWGPFQSTLSISVSAFFIFRFILGVAAAPTYPTAGQGVAKWVAPLSQGRANGIVIASVGLGSALAPPLVSYIMVEWGWRLALLVSSLPALVIALIWLRVPDDPVDVSTEKIDSIIPAAELKGRLRSVGFILLTFSYTLQGYVGYIFVSWFYLYLVQERHFSLFDRRLDGQLAMDSLHCFNSTGWIYLRSPVCR